MRALSPRGVALALGLGLAPVLVACGVLLDVADDPTGGPDRAEGGQDESRTAPDGGNADTMDADAAVAVDACATPAACAPELLTKLGGVVVRLVVAGSSLYGAYIDGADRRVVRMAAGSAGPALDLDPFANGPDSFRSDSNIVVDSSGAVYWGTSNGLRRHEAGVGANASLDAGITSLSTLGAPVTGVRIAADGRLHFTVNGPPAIPMPNVGHIASCALPGCSDVQLSTTVPMPLDVIVVGASRWWMGTDAALDNLALRTVGFVSPPQVLPSRMVSDGQHIFWSTLDGLRRFTMADNGLVDLLATPTGNTNRINGIALDLAGALYVTQQSNVLRCTIAAGGDKCTFTTLATTVGRAEDVAVDATHVYWGTADGSVWRLRKP